MTAIVDYDLGDELGIGAPVNLKDCSRGGGRWTWMDQHTAPRVPRTLATTGTSIDTGNWVDACVDTCISEGPFLLFILWCGTNSTEYYVGSSD